MPCFDGREERNKKHAAKAVPILCELIRTLPASQWPTGLAEWAHEHAEIDRQDGRVFRVYSAQLEDIFGNALAPSKPVNVRFSGESMSLTGAYQFKAERYGKLPRVAIFDTQDPPQRVAVFPSRYPEINEGDTFTLDN